eukprot:Seg843.3 transcript_id=Seg843.3/GoldUCD/mRNA.D3Y31 product="ZP domain-containing protein" protein_id=Seg843.3/GoldUCD/D3Y31
MKLLVSIVILLSSFEISLQQQVGKACVARDDAQGHYTCNDDGTKKCMPGWSDPSNNCLQDSRSEVSCGINFMRIEIDRKYFDPTKYSRISLKDESCKSSLSETKIVLDSAPQKCGSTKIENENYIIYQNEVYMKAIPTGKIVTREHDIRVTFSCSYNKSGMVSIQAFTPITIVDVKEDGFGEFQFHFKMFTDSTYSSAHTKYPIEARLTDNLYFEANTTANDNDLVILIDQCYATPTMDRNNALKYTFIENRCALEDNVKFVKAERKKQRFSMQAFTFIQEISTVYVHCVVFMCRKSATSGQCVSGCEGNNINRARRDLSSYGSADKKSYSKYKLLDIGPIHRRKRSIGSGNSGAPKSSPMFKSWTIVGLVTGVAVLGLIIAGMVVKMRRSRRGNNIPIHEIVAEPQEKSDNQNLI